MTDLCKAANASFVKSDVNRKGHILDLYAQ